MSYSGQSKMFRLLTSCPDLFIFLHSTNKLPYIWCLQVVSVLFPPIGLRCPGFTRHLHLKYISVLQSDVHPQIFQCRLCFQQCWKNAGTWFQWNPQLGRIQCLGFDVFLFELFLSPPEPFSSSSALQTNNPGQNRSYGLQTGYCVVSMLVVTLSASPESPKSGLW